MSDSASHREWLLERQSGIGGSDIAAILGLSKWRTAADVYLSKVTEIDEHADDETEAQFIGKEIEQSILNIYEKRAGVTLWRSLGIIRSEDVPHFLGSYDAVAWTENSEDSYVVDAKSVDVSRAPEWGADGSGNCPEDLALQMLWYMGIGGFQKGDLAALIGGRNFRIVTIDRADDLIQWMQSEADRFWSEHVLKGVPPPIDAEHRYAMRAVKHLYGTIVPRTAQLAPTDFLQKVLREYFTGQAMESAGKKLKAKAKVLLTEMTGGAEKAEISGTGIQITRKLVRKEAYTVEAQDYVDLRIKLPKGSAKPMLEEAQRLLTGMVTVEDADGDTEG